MSDRTTSSSRWSRRKREVAKAEPRGAKPGRAVAPPTRRHRCSAVQPGARPADAAPAEPSESEFDLSSLPSLEFDHRRRPTSPASCAAACRRARRAAALRRAWVGRSGDSRFHRPRGKSAGTSTIPPRSPASARSTSRPRGAADGREARRRGAGSADKVEDTLQSAGLKTAAPQESHVQDRPAAADVNSPEPAARPHDVAEQCKFCTAQNRTKFSDCVEARGAHGGALPR